VVIIIFVWCTLYNLVMFNSSNVYTNPSSLFKTKYYKIRNNIYCVINRNWIIRTSSDACGGIIRISNWKSAWNWPLAEIWGGSFVNTTTSFALSRNQSSGLVPFSCPAHFITCTNRESCTEVTFFLLFYLRTISNLRQNMNLYL